jgi:hypothetical protein
MRDDGLSIRIEEGPTLKNVSVRSPLVNPKLRDALIYRRVGLVDQSWMQNALLYWDKVTPSFIVGAHSRAPPFRPKPLKPMSVLSTQEC